MNKLPLLLILPATAAFAGLVLWNLDLQAQLQELRSSTDAVVETVESDGRSAPEPRASRSADRTQSQVRALEERLMALEARSFEPRAAAAGLAAGAEPAGVEAVTSDAEAAEAEVSQALAAADVSAEFRAKVYAVLEEREMERRLERRAREAERMTAGLLRGLEVPENQQEAVQIALSDYLAKRAELRDNEDLTPEDRRARQEELDAARDATLEGILGAETFASVQERRDRAVRRSGRRRANPGGQLGGQLGGRRRNGATPGGD